MANSSLRMIICGPLQGKEKLEDTKGAIRDRKSKIRKGQSETVNRRTKGAIIDRKSKNERGNQRP